MRRQILLGPLCLFGLLCAIAPYAVRAADAVPHGQDRPPGEPLSPQEALKRIVVPEGFSAELVVAEPELVNPVAMAIDDRGQFWVAESVEYPRHAAGRGKDRIKIFQDTDGDGTCDKNTLFADGLNIPSGIAIGHGGVWVANAPDIMFYKLGPDDKPIGEPEVVVTGFGRDDTHELPNSLTWGPDGWLYGLNGVFNPTVIKSNNGRTYEFTCAMFRIHPQTREFQVFCEGTSNPWGIAWDVEGSAFVSACVIDHLWHFVETGYYRRQAGAYPRFTWFSESIVTHKHQKAAYCGLHYFDSDAYPEQYRNRLYMGNIHGACINVDRLRHEGSTYVATGEPDFLSANDPWFMPVAQTTGPDGSLYVLDWYDRYHCYQDALRDSPGIDRKRGRLYRIRYKDTPRGQPFDLTRESDDELLARLEHPNLYFREHAQRLLCERMNPELQSKLQTLTLDDSRARTTRLHALWALVGGGPLETQFQLRLLASDEGILRAWGVRAAGDADTVDPRVRQKVVDLATDPCPDVRLQVAIAARKLDGVDALSVLLQVLAASSGDKLIPHIVWQNLHPLAEGDPARIVREVSAFDLAQANAIVELLPRISERLLAIHDESAAALCELLLRQETMPSAVVHSQLQQLNGMIATGELRPEQLQLFAARLSAVLSDLRGIAPANRFAAMLLAAGLKLPGAEEALLNEYRTGKLDAGQRLSIVEMLLALEATPTIEMAGDMLRDVQSPAENKRALLAALSRSEQKQIAELLIDVYPNLPVQLQADAIEVLTQRTTWSKMLLEAIGRGQLSPTVLNASQAARLAGRGDDELHRLVSKHWGNIRTEEKQERQRVIAEIRRLLTTRQGDPPAGGAVFNKACAQCHKIFGHGAEIGPDLTFNGRNDFEQLLSNVFDPSLVVGRAYQTIMVITADGRTLSGLLAEEGQDRVVLMLEGGKREIVHREDVDELHRSEQSLMPEGIEKLLTPDEIIDLFAFLALAQAPDGWPNLNQTPSPQTIGIAP